MIRDFPSGYVLSVLLVNDKANDFDRKKGAIVNDDLSKQETARTSETGANLARPRCLQSNFTW